MTSLLGMRGGVVEIEASDGEDGWKAAVLGGGAVQRGMKSFSRGMVVC